MTIHIIAAAVIFKILLFACGEFFLAAFVLWPINDKDTSRTQIGIFSVISLIAFTLIFTDFIKVSL